MRRRLLPGQRRRVVNVTRFSAPKSKMWAFCYADFAQLFGISEDAVRKWVSRGKFSPGNLLSICRLWASKNQ